MCSIRAGGRARRLCDGLGTLWLAEPAGPKPSKVRRFYRRHPEAWRAAGVTKHEVA